MAKVLNAAALPGGSIQSVLAVWISFRGDFFIHSFRPRTKWCVLADLRFGLPRV